MNEITFLQQNAEKWQRFERQYNESEQTDPDALADNFVELTGDLSYARTFYPGSKTEQYLNTLAAKTHLRIYTNKKEKSSRILTFWKYELPMVFRDSRKELLYSFLAFTVSVAVGAISQALDASFARIILGDAYVNMTLVNIENNDPMAVYKKVNALPMFLGITLNNVIVSFKIFVLGTFCSIGAVWGLFQNGVMLGSFQYFFYQQGLLAESALTIWIHGTFEISAVILAGAAGLILGNGFLFPGTYTRLESFKRGARRGVKMIVGIVPLWMAAAFLEGFVTRHTDMPIALSAGIIVVSLALVTFYIYIYPNFIGTQHHDT